MVAFSTGSLASLVLPADPAQEGKSGKKKIRVRWKLPIVPPQPLGGRRGRQARRRGAPPGQWLVELGAITQPITGQYEVDRWFCAKIISRDLINGYLVLSANLLIYPVQTCKKWQLRNGLDFAEIWRLKQDKTKGERANFNRLRDIFGNSRLSRNHSKKITRKLTKNFIWFLQNILVYEFFTVLMFFHSSCH